MTGVTDRLGGGLGRSGGADGTARDTVSVMTERTPHDRTISRDRLVQRARAITAALTVLALASTGAVAGHLATRPAGPPVTTRSPP